MNGKILALLTAASLLLLATACQDRPSTAASSQAPANPQEATMNSQTDRDFRLSSPAFEPGQTIPVKYTCDGMDISPPLAWSHPPGDAASFALIMDDPDAPAGIWVHWVIFDMPADARELPEGVPPDPVLEAGSVQGTNSWGRVGYGGPCPPRGTHRYFFKLYALDTALGLESSATKADVLAAMEGHVLAQAELMGVYQR